MTLSDLSFFKAWPAAEAADSVQNCGKFFCRAAEDPSRGKKNSYKRHKLSKAKQGRSEPAWGPPSPPSRQKDTSTTTTSSHYENGYDGKKQESLFRKISFDLSNEQQKKNSFKKSRSSSIDDFFSLWSSSAAFRDAAVFSVHSQFIWEQLILFLWVKVKSCRGCHCF